MISEFISQIIQVFEIEVEIPVKQNISRIPKLRLRPSKAKYFLEVEVETQRSKIF